MRGEEQAVEIVYALVLGTALALLVLLVGLPLHLGPLAVGVAAVAGVSLVVRVLLRARSRGL